MSVQTAHRGNPDELFSFPTIILSRCCQGPLRLSAFAETGVLGEGDGTLSRGLVDGESDEISKGWLTNQMEGHYFDPGGSALHFTSFVKIVWVGPGGSLWGQYKIIQEIYNDPVGGYNGLYSKVAAPGFGLNDGWTTE